MSLIKSLKEQLYTDGTDFLMSTNFWGAGKFSRIDIVGMVGMVDI